MKTPILQLLRYLLVITFTGGTYTTISAQEPAKAPAPTQLDTSQTAYNYISSQLKLYVFPSKGQSNQQQKLDEYECYKWAMQQSGIDPLNLPRVQAAPAETGPTGAAVGGAAAGCEGDAKTGVSLWRGNDQIGGGNDQIPNSKYQG